VNSEQQRFEVVVLDDYQHALAELVDWSVLGDDVHVEFLHEHLPTADDVVAALDTADCVVANRERTAFPREVLERLPRLRLLVTTGRRNAAIDMSACADLGIMVNHTGDAGRTTVEMTWALILAATRHIPTEVANMRAGGWMTTIGGDLRGARLGVLGLGRLGAEVAAIGLAFGMEVVAWSHNLTAQRCEEVGVEYVGRDELFSSSDVLSIHLVLSERTRGLVGEAELRSMKRTSLLVNTSRGPIVDEDALIEAARHGWIGAAALDVYETEPLPAEHPLRTLDRVLPTPHLGYVTEHTLTAWYTNAVECIFAYRAGSPVRVLVPS